MSKGKAKGVDREYQVFCRNLLQTLREGLKPCSGDGIDVEFCFAGTKWSLDVALEDSAGNLVVAECERWGRHVPQGEIGAFAFNILELREATGKSVEGFFFAKTDFQIGAVRVGFHKDISLVICGQDQSTSRFVASYEIYNPEQMKRLKAWLSGITDVVGCGDAVTAELVGPDGTIKSAKQNPSRCAIIGAEQVKGKMAKEILSDALWAVIQPLLPPRKPKPKGGRPPIPDQKVLTGILFVLMTGIPWERLPKEMGCGSGMTCWRRLKAWQQAGVWRRLHKVLLDRLGEAD